MERCIPKQAKKKAYLGEVGFSCFSSQTGGCPARDNPIIACEARTWIGIR
jgi:hypothetical protein